MGGMRNSKSSSVQEHSLSAGIINNTITTDETGFYRWGTRILMLTKAKGLAHPIYPLTRAGCELARIAQVQLDSSYSFKVARWIRSKKTDATFVWADTPHPNWTGTVSQLQWQEIPDVVPTIAS